MRLLKYSVLLHNFTCNISIGGSCLQQLLLFCCLPNGNFISLLFFQHLLIGILQYRKECPFSLICLFSLCRYGLADIYIILWIIIQWHQRFRILNHNNTLFLFFVCSQIFFSTKTICLQFIVICLFIPFFYCFCWFFFSVFPWFLHLKTLSLIWCHLLLKMCYLFSLPLPQCYHFSPILHPYFYLLYV